jgi:hypothetical protein
MRLRQIRDEGRSRRRAEWAQNRVPDGFGSTCANLPSVTDTLDRLRSVAVALASEECAGRAPGTSGGLRARELVTGWFEDAGLEPAGEHGYHQPIPRIGGANILGQIGGPNHGRHILLAAHYDHLGVYAGETYPGANDNASGVAVILEVARQLTERQTELGRDVLVVAFDSEEPPHFLESTMGSIHFVKHPTVPLESIELMICLDLVGSPLGGADVPADIGNLVVVSGAERAGLGGLVDATSSEGVNLRRIGADIVPPLSDHFAFQAAGVPSLFLTSGRNRYYHTPEDTPEKLDYPMMAALTKALAELITRASRVEGRIEYDPDASDLDVSVTTIHDLVRAAAPVAAEGDRMLAIMEAFAGGRGSDFFAGRETDVLRQVLEAAEYALA